jgi:allophanate hydrolase
MLPDLLSIQSLRELYLADKLQPADLVEEIHQRIARDKGNPIWITVLDKKIQASYIDNLKHKNKNRLPLWGIPFAIKDNIDLAQVMTTAACPAFAYTATHSATVVQTLITAGALPIGKTNMDQFATGLVGVRSPYGEVHNAYVPEFISGGSSSGSAVAVARGHVAFALGTDTAGSGRVPASLNNLVGLKPTRGLLSTKGVVPACRTLDCVSLFAHNLADAGLLLDITQGFDAEDSYSRVITIHNSINNRLKIAIPKPAQLEFYSDAESGALFAQSIAQAKQQGAEIVEIDFSAFLEAAQLLYRGPWVAERWLTAKEVLSKTPEEVLPVIRSILASGNNMSIAESYRFFYRIAELRRAIEPLLVSVDAFITPTIARPYKRAALRDEPIQLNTQLGYYTNFMNLLDLAALAVPDTFYRNGLPNGVTLFHDAGSDRQLLHIAARLFPHAKH